MRKKNGKWDIREVILYEKKKEKRWEKKCKKFRTAVWLVLARLRNVFSTHRRYPATAHRGDFWLLGFPPGPVRLSLANLGPVGYPAGPILTTSLARTSVQRGRTRHSCPHLKPSTQSDLQSSWITGARHRSRSTSTREMLLFQYRESKTF